MYPLSYNDNVGGPASYDNDIAVVLTDEFNLNEYVRPACLPKSDLELNNGYGVVSGFGQQGENKAVSYDQKLALVAVRIWNQPICHQFQDHLTGRMTSNQICAGGDGYGGDGGTCTGDSGGGLVINLNGKWTVVGLVSSNVIHVDPVTGKVTKFCGRGHAPTTFTKVSNYIDFINYSDFDHSIDTYNRMLVYQVPTTSGNFEEYK